MEDKKRKEMTASLLKDMEATAARMRELIVAMPPHDLLGYIYAQHMMKALADQTRAEQQREADGPNDLINENQFLLEYVHAVLASDAAPADLKFNEAQCAELFELGRKLREQAMFFAMATSADTKNGVFGPDRPSPNTGPASRPLLCLVDGRRAALRLASKTRPRN